MATATISIDVDAETAQAFTEASSEQRRKLQLLLKLRLQELIKGPSRPLPEIMHMMGAEAESRGLAPAMLESLLRDE